MSRKPLSTALAPLVLLVGLSAPAAAQDIKPRILLIFDTSGSMGFDIDTGDDTFGDNSREYPGTGGISRLSVAKNVISGILESTSEADFALMRYPQRQGLAINNGFERGAFTAYADLQNHPLNYMGYCGGDALPGAPDDPFAVVVPFGADNELPILSWMDGHEAFPGDPELRAEGPTPIAESLRIAESYYQGVLARDPNLPCRKDYVILLTDGDESCTPPGVDVQAELLNRAIALRQMNIVPAGGGPAVLKDVKTYVIGFAVTNRIVNQLNTLARAGGTAFGPDGNVDLINGETYTAADQAGLRHAFSRILADAIPVEVCNGLDDDCDGRIDEGVLNACGLCGGAPIEICNGVDDDCDGQTDEGVLNACGGCGPVPVEICNGIDDDCDGAIDEEVSNACGGCAAVVPEVCNGVDDDCDGIVDNVPGAEDALTRACGQDLGECRAGVETCRDGDWVDCTGVGPSEEICDGKDNDCNGLTDELTRPCGPAAAIGDVGQCRVGRQACVFAACQHDPSACDPDGWSLDCQGGVGPTDEICDGLDNNCDGNADEDLINACGRCGESLGEACNGEDDNCDGRIDENAVCPRGYLCFVGECVAPCDNSGECGGDYTCVQVYPGAGFCHPNACAGNDCPAGYECNAVSRTCDDPCVGVTCPDGQGCALGQCVQASCRTMGCGDGERCGANGACEADPCAAADCGPTQFCREGECIEACIQRSCGAGQTCYDGACVEDPCGGRCLRTQLCDPADGSCTEDPCARLTCPVGTVCVDGECHGEAPCAHITCPNNTRCVDGSCTDSTPGVPPDLTHGGVPGGDAGLPPPPSDAGPAGDGGPATGDGGSGTGGTIVPDAAVLPPADGGTLETPSTPADTGCGCRTGPRGGSALPLLLLTLSPLLRRRPSRRLRAGARGI